MLNLNLATIISRVITLVVAFTTHEFSHAKTADLLGDSTPRSYGRLTLNPLAHLDVMGTLMLLVAGFGWAKPVPINPYTLRRRSSAAVMLVSFAGPLSNLALALLAAIPLRLNILPSVSPLVNVLPSPQSFMMEFMFINLMLFFFNLIPLAPLDGEKIIEYFLPPSAQAWFERIRPYGPAILLILVLVGPYLGFDLIGAVIYPPILMLMRLLIG